MTLKKGFLISLAVICSFVFILLIAMTQSFIATPVVNKGLEKWGPQGSSVSKAHLKFPRLFTLSVTDADLPDLAQISAADISFNPFGFIPSVTWIPKFQSNGGSVILPERDPEAAPLALDLKNTLNEIRIEDFVIQLDPTQVDTKIEIQSASGSVHLGTVSVEAYGNGVILTAQGSQDASETVSFGGDLNVEGDNVKDLAGLFGYGAPDTPPFKLNLAYNIAATNISLQISSGSVGDSDISGTVDLDMSQTVPLVNASLSSKSLDLDDLGIVFGLPTGTQAGETVGEEQKRAKAEFDASDRLIPNAKIDFERLDAIDGNIRYAADTVQAGAGAIETLGFDVEIAGRVVRASEIKATFPQGTINAYLTLDGTQSPASTDVKGNVTDLSLSSLGASAFARGNLQGEFAFNTKGNDFQSAASTATGNAAIWSTNLEIVEIGSELAGLDLGESLILLLEDNNEKDYVPSRCAALSLRADQGVSSFAPAVIDTEDSLIALVGGLNLEDETLEFEVKTDAKDASFGSLFGDISLGGTFREPSISVIDEKTALQAGIAVVLGSIAPPLAALPFVEVGDGDDAPCAQLLARAKTVADTQGQR